MTSCSTYRRACRVAAFERCDPGRVTRTIAGRDLDHGDLPADGPAERTEPAGLEGLDRLRLLLACAMGTVLVSYALLVPAAAVVVLPVGMPLDAAFAATIPLWLAAHQIPLVIEGQPFGVLPLLPTGVVVVVVAIGARWAVRRLGGRFRVDAGPVLASVAGAHAAVAVLGSALLPSAAEVAVAPWAAMLGGGLVGGAAGLVGVLGACPLPVEWRDRLPVWCPAAGRAAAVALAGLTARAAPRSCSPCCCGCRTSPRPTKRRRPASGRLSGSPCWRSATCPTPVLAGTSWVLGPGFAVGTATASPFAAVADERSTFPLLAVFPAGPAPAWAPAVLLLPGARRRADRVAVRAGAAGTPVARGARWGRARRDGGRVRRGSSPVVGLRRDRSTRSGCRSSCWCRRCWFWWACRPC